MNTSLQDISVKQPSDFKKNKKLVCNRVFSRFRAATLIIQALQYFDLWNAEESFSFWHPIILSQKHTANEINLRLFNSFR